MIQYVKKIIPEREKMIGVRFCSWKKYEKRKWSVTTKQIRISKKVINYNYYLKFKIYQNAKRIYQFKQKDLYI